MKINWKFIGFMAVMIIGSGGAWQYQQIKIDKLNYDLERSRQASDLRASLYETIEKIITITSEFSSLDLCNKPDGTQLNTARRTHVKLDLLKENFRDIETKLAALEQRKARVTKLDLSAPCPLKLN